MKRFQFLAGLLCGAVLFGGGAVYAAGVMAEHNPQRVYVDGQAVQMEAYTIDGFNYVKLRDVGELVGFNVYWDGSFVQVDSDASYTGLSPVQQTDSGAIPGDKAAVALFNMILKDDAASAVELFGYASEAEARRDMGLDGNLYDEMTQEVLKQFSSMGFTASKEDADTFVNAFMTMFKEVKMTARVKSLDEKTGTAVITCTISTFDSKALEEAIEGAMNSALAELDLALLEGENEDALFSVLLKAIAKAIAGLKPDGADADFDVEFALETLTINGKTCRVWLPKDAEAFGEAISSTVLGG